LAKVVPFKNRRRDRPWIRRRRGRLAEAPWQPLAALVAVAGALWLGSALYPSSGVERHLSSLVGNGTSAASGGGGFVLCAGASRPNCVIDGDTIRYRGLKIRLADIDAPEVFSPKCASEAARGKRATQRLLELINAGPFQLVSGGRDEDRYGRKLRTITRAGRSVGATLVAEGLARPWDGARRSWCG
jgi:endonuclease YncB( thermonuclease family)